jgi:hypothetical protein
MNNPTADKDAQRQALADAVKEYQNRGGKVPRCQMSKRRSRWMSLTSRNPQRALRLVDLITD